MSSGGTRSGPWSDRGYSGAHRRDRGLRPADPRAVRRRSAPHRPSQPRRRLRSTQAGPWGQVRSLPTCSRPLSRGDRHRPDPQSRALTANAVQGCSAHRSAASPNGQHRTCYISHPHGSIAYVAALARTGDREPVLAHVQSAPLRRLRLDLHKPGRRGHDVRVFPRQHSVQHRVLGSSTAACANRTALLASISARASHTLRRSHTRITRRRAHRDDEVVKGRYRIRTQSVLRFTHTLCG